MNKVFLASGSQPCFADQFLRAMAPTTLYIFVKKARATYLYPMAVEWQWLD